MALLKTYKCCICHKKLENKPYRLVRQHFKRNRYYNVYNYDFCDRCFKIYLKWIRKHREDGENEFIKR